MRVSQVLGAVLLTLIIGTTDIVNAGDAKVDDCIASTTTNCKLKRAREFLTERKYREAGGALKEVNLRDISSDDLRRYLRARAELNTSRRDYDTALADLGNLLAFEPEDLFALAHRCYVYFENDQIVEAVNDCDLAAHLLEAKHGEINKLNEAYYRALLASVQSGIFSRRGRGREAIQVIEEALPVVDGLVAETGGFSDSDPRYSLIVDLSELMLVHGYQSDEIRATLKGAEQFRQSGIGAKATLVLAHTYLREGKVRSAFKHFVESTEFADAAPENFFMACAVGLVATEKREKSQYLPICREAYERGERLNWAFGDAYASALERAEKFDEARRVLTKTIGQHPHDAERLQARLSSYFVAPEVVLIGASE